MWLFADMVLHLFRPKNRWSGKQRIQKTWSYVYITSGTCAACIRL